MAQTAGSTTRPGRADRGGPQASPHVLREYAFLADGWRGALIGPRGDIDWLCVPSWDSDAVFAGLLGGRGGYAVSPAADRFVWGGYYELGSLIWTSRWVTTKGIIQCREAMAYPGDPHRAVLLRQIQAVDGDAAVDLTLDARAGFGRLPFRELHRDRDTWTGRTGGLHLRWTGAATARPDGDGVLRGRLRVAAGGYHDLVLEISDRPFDAAPVEPHQAWHTTAHAWQAAVPDLQRCVAHRDAVHAHAVLRGMTTPNGGMVAAATTSLPERAEAGRNYDYRYAWIRDQSFAGQAAAAAGVDDLLDAAVKFVGARLLEHGETMAPAYTANSGEPIPSQRPLPHLAGYPGAPVRTGNWVNGQFQLDAFGESMLLLSAAIRRDRADIQTWHALETAATAIATRWQQPDSGVWELAPKQWTHSKLTCVAGLKAGAAVAPGPQAAEWTTLADAILAETSRHGLHPSGRWQRAYDDPRIDSSLLLPAMRGALAPDDPRTLATLATVTAQLQQDGYIYRYRPDERPLGEAEGAFLLCGLVAALAAERVGDRDTAARWFERNRAACGPPGLYAEEYDVRQRQLRGNLPQAFVHALLLQAAVELAEQPDEQPADPGR